MAQVFLQDGCSKTILYGFYLCWATISERRHEKACLRVFWPGKTQTGLLSYRD